MVTMINSEAYLDIPVDPTIKEVVHVIPYEISFVISHEVLLELCIEGGHELFVFPFPMVFKDKAATIEYIQLLSRGLHSDHMPDCANDVIRVYERVGHGHVKLFDIGNPYADDEDNC